MVTPYYDQAGITIYHADAREVVSTICADSVITDPVWPNAVAQLFGADDPQGELTDVLIRMHASVNRVVVHLGCDSDPRFLRAVPQRWPFFRVCWLEYVRPNYKGRLMNTGDVAYAFGTPPPSRDGRRVIPGVCIQSRGGARQNGHPCPRRLSHVRWLLKWFADGVVLDPFMGIGTTLVAAKESGIPAVGIEIEEKYCEVAARRLEQGVLWNERAAGSD